MRKTSYYLAALMTACGIISVIMAATSTQADWQLASFLWTMATVSFWMREIIGGLPGKGVGDDD